MANELAKQLINAGAHFGHGVSRWDPKMRPYIFAKRGQIHIIDIRKTLKGLIIAKKLLAEVAASGKDIIFVGTKRQAQKAVETAAQNCSMHFVSQRWLGGMLTNYRTIRSRLQRLEQLEAMTADGTIDSESKKQASRLKRELRKIKSNLDGVRKMSQLPGAVVVVDARKEYIALREARKLGIPTVAILDTDSDPDTVDVPIPANDDSLRGIGLLLNEMSDAVAFGRTQTPSHQLSDKRPRHARVSRSALARAEDAEPQEPVGVSEKNTGESATPKSE